VHSFGLRLAAAQVQLAENHIWRDSPLALEHPFFSFSSAVRVVIERQVVVQASHDLVAIRSELRRAMLQIEEVSVLAPLQKGAQFGAEDFFGLEGHEFGLCRVPVICHREGIAAVAEQDMMLAGVDLDLQLERRLRGRLGREAEDQVHRMPRLLAVALAEPGQASASRMASTVGPMGSAWVCTKSLSS